MKKAVFAVAGAVFLLLSGTVLLADNFSGSDDFNDNNINLSKWDDTMGGFGDLTEANQLLELDLDGGGSSPQGHLPWKLNYGSYTQDWEVYYDINVPTFTQFSGDEASSMSIFIYALPMGTGGYIGMTLGQETGSSPSRKFMANMSTLSDTTEAEIMTTSTESSVRIHWDASSTTLYCDYDSDGGSDSWTNLKSWNIAPGQPYSWNMTTGSTFICFLIGQAEITHGGETNPSGDNFVANSTPPTAPLAIFRPGSGLWALRNITRAYFGGSSDIPVYSDYDGDGTKDIAIFRGSTGLWALRGITRAYFGGGSDEPIPGDYNDDGSADIAIFRESTGLWAVRGLTRGYFGATGDIPLEP